MKHSRTELNGREDINMYVYIQSEPGLWTVGFYDPTGVWHPESDHNSTDDAAKRVRYLNGDHEEYLGLPDDGTYRS